MTRTLTKKNNGIAMLLIMIILIVATGIGIWGLSASRSNIQKAGSRNFTTILRYQAEQGLQKAVRRIQGMCQVPPVDEVNARNATASGVTGGDYRQGKDVQTFLLVPCEDTNCGITITNEPCPAGFDAKKDFDNWIVNVDCNFLGVTDPGTQVSLVRKTNLLDTDGKPIAIFLLNSIATDKSGHKQGIQGVVAIPYDLAAGPSICTRTPYLASSKAITE